MDSWQHFDDPQLPSKEAFYSKLSDMHISDEEYAHAEKVWKAFDCKTLGDYHGLYNCTDVLLLADVFETFRKPSLMQYKLDPANYCISPRPSWDALLKKTRVKLELLTDHFFIENSMCGSWCFHGLKTLCKC